MNPEQKKRLIDIARKGAESEAAANGVDKRRSCLMYSLAVAMR